MTPHQLRRNIRDAQERIEAAEEKIHSCYLELAVHADRLIQATVAEDRETFGDFDKVVFHTVETEFLAEDDDLSMSRSEAYGELGVNEFRWTVGLHDDNVTLTRKTKID